MRIHCFQNHKLNLNIRERSTEGYLYLVILLLDFYTPFTWGYLEVYIEALINANVTTCMHMGQFGYCHVTLLLAVGMLPRAIQVASCYFYRYSSTYDHNWVHYLSH